MKHMGFLFVCFAIAVGAIVLCSRGPGGLVALPFTHGPLFASLVLAHFLNSQKAQATFIFSSVIYTIWFLWAFTDIFFIHPDPQSPIGLFFIGIYSLPVMLLFWLIAICFGAQKYPLIPESTEATATGASTVP